MHIWCSSHVPHWRIGFVTERNHETSLVVGPCANNEWISGLAVHPGDLVTSVRETGENILLPYPIRQSARSFHLRSMSEWSGYECWCFLELVCFVLYHDWNSELCCKYEKCSFGQLGSLFQFNGESVRHLDEIVQHAALALAASYLKAWKSLGVLL